MTYSSNDSSGRPPEKTLFSPAKALQKLVAEERSGRLTVADPNDASVQWRVYFGGGQIHYATGLMGQRERLTYLFSRESTGLEPCLEIDAPNDYQMVYQYWRSQQLPMNWVRQVLAMLTQEAITQFLAISQGQLKYDSSIGLDPLLLSVPFRQLVLPVRDTVMRWTHIREDISSPFQRPSIVNYDSCLQAVWNDSASCQQLQEVSDLAGENLTLYEIAHRLSTDVLVLAAFLQPLLRNGGMEMKEYQTTVTSKRPIVACVDDSPTIQQFVKLSLESSGYDVLSLSDPTQAIMPLLNHQPIVILMDIEMPGIDGYELCRLARQVEVLRKIPIVMLTGREGIIDRVRARIAGCTAYLTKPFNPQELLGLVQKLALEETVAPL
ncbi:response regulator [Altericista sp. CCNU0014]|uniref:response regulator n=1 Tax=Altericista sp. CCNU0014 TaxID=3082949 RepID=UPI0038509992